LTPVLKLLLACHRSSNILERMLVNLAGQHAITCVHSLEESLTKVAVEQYDLLIMQSFLLEEAPALSFPDFRELSQAHIVVLGSEVHAHRYERLIPAQFDDFIELPLRNSQIQSVFNQVSQKAESDLYSAAFSNLLEAAILVDMQGNICDVNKQGCALLQRQKIELIGQPFASLIEAGSNADLSFLAHTSLQSQSQVLNLTNPDGSILPLTITRASLDAPADKFGLIMLQGLRNSSDEKQRTMQQQLQRAQRMEAIGTLAGGIAHDFNNILQSMYLYLGMAMDALPEGDVKDDISHVSKAAQRARELVDQILTFSRRGDSKKSEVLLQFVAKEALKFLNTSLPVSVQLIEDIDTECSPVYCDPTQFHQIFMNLCTNAYEALPESQGSITVQLREIDFLETDAGFKSLDPGRYVELKISDTGTGIPPTILAQIFNPFFSTKPPGMGSGLGLSVVYSMVEEFNGEILVDSQVGQGTTFRLLLPAVERPAAEEDDLELEYIDLQGQPVFLLEPDAEICEGTQVILEKMGCSVTVYSDPVTLLDSGDLWEGEAGLVLSAYTMPSMSGLKLAERIKFKNPAIMTMIMTGDDLEEQLDPEKMSDVDILIKKPWRTQDLIAAISELVKRQRANRN